MRCPRSLAAAVASLYAIMAFAAALQPMANDEIRLRLRTRIEPFHDNRPATEATFESTIVPAHTAIIVTDMWDKHWCRGATERVGELAVKMEPVLSRARRAGILIVHAPSETMGFYANSPGRLLAENAPKVKPPQPLRIHDAPLPIDDSNGGCDTPGDKFYKAWTRETAKLTIAPGDAISDSGEEIYNLLKERHIDTILYMGVHANMCILNRAFGVRQMSRWDIRCIIVRDLMDAMYEPSSRPFVSHAAGTKLVFQFIEQYWAPSVTSKDLMQALDTAKTP